MEAVRMKYEVRSGTKHDASIQDPINPGGEVVAISARTKKTTVEFGNLIRFTLSDPMVEYRHLDRVSD
jgi:hypothetical protein